MTQTYIEWLTPGIIVSETHAEKVDDRSIPKELNEVDERAFAFRFYDRTEVETTDGEQLVGKDQNHSGWFYIGGEELTLEQIESKHPEKSVLISNMKINNIKRVVMTKYGQAMPLEKEDTLLIFQKK